MSAVPTTSSHIATTGDVDVNDLVPYFGVCCFISSCYCDWPSCLGAGCENTLCCLKNKIIMCKPSIEPDAKCKCCLVDCDVVSVNVCIQSRTQLFCLDLRASLPPSDSIPCLLTICFVTCCFKYGCHCNAFANIKTIAGEGEPMPTK